MPGQGLLNKQLVMNYRKDFKEQKIDMERLEYWLGVGAKMSDRVKKITGK